MSSEDKLIIMRARHAEAAANEANGIFASYMAGCESPIEQMLVGEMLGQGILIYAQANLEEIGRIGRERSTKDRYPKTNGYIDATSAHIAKSCRVFFYGQFPVTVGGRDIRLDMAMAVVWSGDGDEIAPRWIAIECDGHDFHERTKAQAAADRSRDRLLTAGGWKVVRFTGSEIYANAAGCVDELYGIVMSTWGSR